MTIKLLIPASMVLLMNAISIAPSLAQTIAITEETSAEVNEKEITQVDAKQKDRNSVISQTDTKPIPFIDLSPDHWAFEAVMNLYY